MATLGFVASVLVLCLSSVRATDGVPDSPKAIQAELRSFATVASVLYVAAHPDDESNVLLALLARGRGDRTAYLSVTRGDGGQNEIGPEFGEKLGLARTHELQAARRIDGGRQYFTRAIDYGYSKDVSEALRMWEHDKVLGDVVRVYRTFRPDVVIAGMSPVQTPGQHGQHVASAVLAIEAFKISGDPAKYPEHLADGLAPWQPKRIVGRAGGGRGGRGGNTGNAGNNAAGLRLAADKTDPTSGDDMSLVGGRSRSQHKTQGMGGGNFGGFGGGGINVQTFALIAGEPGKDDFYDGLDLTFARFPGGAEVAKLTDDAIAKFSVDAPAASVPALLAIRAKLAALPTDRVGADKRAQLDRILQACLGLEVETTAAAAEAVPGETLKLRHTAALKAKEVHHRERSLSPMHRDP